MISKHGRLWQSMLFTPESIGVRSSGNLYAAATGIDNARPASEARRNLTKHGSIGPGPKSRVGYLPPGPPGGRPILIASCYEYAASESAKRSKHA